MNYGPTVFLAAFLALSASWFGFVVTPQIQIGRLDQETNAVQTAEMYPQGRPGLARQGLQVYRAEGCAACHSQQVTQEGTKVDVVLAEAGPNAAAVTEALNKLGVTDVTVSNLTNGLPKTVLHGLQLAVAQATEAVLKTAGAKSRLSLVPFGSDIERVWGARRTVAADFLYDYPAMPGSQRVGPDLASIGVRWPDAERHLRHLYAPSSEVKGSPMPPYRFLFECKRIGAQPSPDALKLSKEFAPPDGFEIVPKPEAQALVAYLLSLHADTPLFEAPLTPPPAATPTNAPVK